MRNSCKTGLECTICGEMCMFLCVSKAPATCARHTVRQRRSGLATLANLLAPQLLLDYWLVQIFMYTTPAATSGGAMHGKLAMPYNTGTMAVIEINVHARCQRASDCLGVMTCELDGAACGLMMTTHWRDD